MKFKIEYRQNGYNEEDGLAYAEDKTAEFPFAFMWDGQREIAPFPCCNRSCRGKYDINALARDFVRSGNLALKIMLFAAEL